MQSVLKVKGLVIAVWEGGARVKTEMGEVYVPPRHIDPRIVWRAEAVMEVTKSDRAPKSSKERLSEFIAERIVAVYQPTPLPPPAEVYGRIDWFDYRKGKGFVRLIGDHPFEKDSARLLGSVIRGLKPQKNDAVRVTVELTPAGLSVTALEFGDRITRLVRVAERKAKEAGVDAADKPLVVTEQGQTVVLGAIPARLSAVMPVFKECLDD